MKDINFKFTVETCLEPNEIKALLACESDEDRFEVLNGIFAEDPNIWDRYYEAALDSLAERKAT
jgi:hypothetical protein